MKYLLCCLLAAGLISVAAAAAGGGTPSRSSTSAESPAASAPAAPDTDLAESTPSPEDEDVRSDAESVLVQSSEDAQYAIAVVPAPLTAEDLLSYTFEDVPVDDPAAGCISYVAARGVLQGVGGGCFAPDSSVTRGALMVVLHRLSGRSGAPYTIAVATPDIDDGDWRFDAISWALYSRIAAGNEDGTFAPDDPVTRAQLAVFLYRYAGYMGVSTTCSGELDGFRDASVVPDYAVEAISWALEKGLYQPIISDTIYPDLPVSRSQLAEVLVSIAAMEDDLLAASLTENLTHTVESASRANHDAIQAAVDAAAKKYGAIGIQAAVVENGVVTDVFNYGWAHKDSAPMTEDHKIRSASISKVFVGTAAMLLQERGVIDLDDDISPYWGVTARNPAHPDTPITFRSLLSHTSSIRGFDDSVSRSYDMVKAQLCGSGYSRTTPGAITSWNYNNYAFGVLGMTLELAADRYLDQILDEYMWSAMEIDAAFEGSCIDGTDLLATLYYHGGSIGRSVPSLLERTRPDFPGGTGKYFAGGLIISAQDLAKLAALFANDGCFDGARLLDAESVAIMESRYDHQLSDGTYQALPFRAQDNIYGRDTLFYHTGSAYGVYNFFSYDPATRDGVVVLTTGASATKDSRGIYAVCGEISHYIYEAIA